jgi:Ca-activated chloride channel homolog
MNLTFSKPEYLIFLLVIPLFIFIHFASIKVKNRKALKFANFDAISRVTGVDLFSRNIVVMILSCIILLILVFSISGTKLHMMKEITEFSFVVAIDNSNSMTADDFKPNRLEFSKKLSKELINLLPEETRIGVVTFGGYSFIKQDLTKDRANINSKIDLIDFSGVGGTNFYEVIVTSSNMLHNEEGKSILLLSDGQANADELEEAIRYALEKNLIIHTVAIGTDKGGEAIYGTSKLNKDTLKALSYQTGGIYIEVDNNQDHQKEFIEFLRLKKALVGIDLSMYLIILAITVFIIEYILITYRYSFLP